MIGGQLSNEILSMEKEVYFLGESVEDFLTMTVDIKNCKNLAEALDI